MGVIDLPMQACREPKLQKQPHLRQRAISTFLGYTHVNQLPSRVRKWSRSVLSDQEITRGRTRENTVINWKMPPVPQIEIPHKLDLLESMNMRERERERDERDIFLQYPVAISESVRRWLGTIKYNITTLRA